ncbi:hypothetical protein BU26DRAFT_44443 [Trematosphaeria pertusa]|uniref:Uncharacterized protein n=1 Tax=Trematosphaeria pertusa TaxID=390896 RepID=A0A6A6I8F7_9PLEO|nr:uncharacterized protein BU26DRAFT_44443 [Trematosphaeria pertusa]KAF2246368.1 hypothetical protein BU26DRAFT_44443 [Trematosphaeria pertusa]
MSWYGAASQAPPQAYSRQPNPASFYPHTSPLPPLQPGWVWERDVNMNWWVHHEPTGQWRWASPTDPSSYPYVERTPPLPHQFLPQNRPQQPTAQNPQYLPLPLDLP